MRITGFHIFVCLDSAHGTDFDTGFLGQCDIRPHPDGQHHHVAADFMAPGANGGDMPVSFKFYCTFSGNDFNPHIFNNLLDDGSPFFIKYRRQYLAQLFHQGDLDAASQQTDTGLNPDAAGTDDNSLFAFHVQNALGVCHGFERRDALFIDARYFRNNRPAAGGQKQFVVCIGLPIVCRNRL